MSVPNELEQAPPVPAKAWDNRGFWEGVERQELVFQRCKDCGTWAHPPRPLCPSCHSLEKEWAPSKGKGKIHSWVTYRESPHPGFKAPYSVVLVELEDGLRLISNLVDTDPDGISIGMPVEVIFEEIAEGVTLPKFRRAG
jgi:uncharacterized OB-fold protein